jgi:hypothetical protein
MAVHRRKRFNPGVYIDPANKYLDRGCIGKKISDGHG